MEGCGSVITRFATVQINREWGRHRRKRAPSKSVIYKNPLFYKGNRCKHQAMQLRVSWPFLMEEKGFPSLPSYYLYTVRDYIEATTGTLSTDLFLI